MLTKLCKKLAKFDDIRHMLGNCCQMSAKCLTDLTNLNL